MANYKDILKRELKGFNDCTLFSSLGGDSGIKKELEKNKRIPFKKGGEVPHPKAGITLVIGVGSGKPMSKKERRMIEEEESMDGEANDMGGKYEEFLRCEEENKHRKNKKKCYAEGGLASGFSNEIPTSGLKGLRLQDMNLGNRAGNLLKAPGGDYLSKLRGPSTKNL